MGEHEWTPASAILVVLAAYTALAWVIIPGIRLWLDARSLSKMEQRRCLNCAELIDDPNAPMGKRCAHDETYRWRDPGPFGLTSCDRHRPE